MPLDTRTPNDSSPQPPAPWRPHFGIGGLLLVTTVACVMSACGYYAVQALRGGVNAKLAFILVTLAAPILLMIVASLMRWLLVPPRRRRR